MTDHTTSAPHQEQSGPEYNWPLLAHHAIHARDRTAALLTQARDENRKLKAQCLQLAAELVRNAPPGTQVTLALNIAVPEQSAQEGDDT